MTAAVSSVGAAAWSIMSRIVLSYAAIFPTSEWAEARDRARADAWAAFRLPRSAPTFSTFSLGTDGVGATVVVSSVLTFVVLREVRSSLALAVRVVRVSCRALAW